jgi:putative spermidine/putrescine transport system ATP-binding protein
MQVSLACETERNIREMPAAAHGLSIESLTKRYGNLVVVDNVSLSVERGEFLTLLGPSGSGKTTILMSVAGFVEPTSGVIRIDDRVITHLPPEKRNFGMVFQGYALFPHMTVGENVAFPLKVRGRPSGEIAERAKAALDLVQLAPLRDRLPSQLSGGQQQRVALARALVFDPDMLLLDEPLSALDKKLRAELQTELKDLHQRLGKTFIYVTHDQDEALSMSDEIAILSQGRIIQKDSPAALYERPLTHFVADFLGKSNFLVGRVGQHDGSGFSYVVNDRRFLQAAAAPAAADGGTVLIGLRPEKVEVRGDARPDTANHLEGTIAKWSYLGANLTIVADTQAGELSATVPSWRSRVTPTVGGEIWLGWEPDASVVLVDDR